MRTRIIILVSLGMLSNSPVLDAYDPVTHREIAERAAQPTVSSVDRVIKDDLGIPAGIAERFPGQSLPGLRNVQELIGDGARSEDDFLRFFNHFHNPLRPWNEAGLRSGLQLGQSSVLWQQNTSQNFSFVLVPPLFFPAPSFGGNWSWQDARRYYLDALTKPTKDDRDTAFAETFEALGRLTHLIQDAPVPAHVRNDLHPRPLGNPDWYEEWKS